jgi:phospholipid/cholesterol/gamma-HCH transport system permease protein
VLLIPMLTIMADAAGVVGGWFFSTQVCGVDSVHYWNHSEAYIGAYEVFNGVIKSILFGGAIAIVSCHRGFHCGAGAEGVGRAATEAFVYSFVTILVLDFFLGIILNGLYYVLFPIPVTLV